MVSLSTVSAGDLGASSNLNQIVEALNGQANTPIAITGVNDASLFAVDIKNAEAGNGRTLRVQDSSGGIHIQADVNGVAINQVSISSGTIAGSTITGATIKTTTITAPTITSPTLSGGVFGAWSTFTPTVSQGGVITFTLNQARYQQIGKVLAMQVQMTFTSTGVPANDIVVGNLPVNALTANVDLPIGTFRYDGTAIRVGAVCQPTITTVKFQVDNQAGFLGTAPSVGLLAGQVLSFVTTCEAA